MKKSCISFIVIVHCLLVALNPATTLASEIDRISSTSSFTIEPTTELYCLAQAATWLDEETIAVGKWDGTITIFKYTTKLSIEQALVPPHKAPVTALVGIGDHCFISSDGPSSLAAWIREKDQHYVLSQTYPFNENYGTVDS